MNKIFLAFLISLFLCACTSLDMNSRKSSESEKITIIDMARYTLTQQSKNRRLISVAEAIRINKETPEVKIRYTGHRQGRMMISWSLENKRVNLIYSGKFLSDSAMWELSIAKHARQISKKKVNPYAKRKSVEEKDFADLRKNKTVLIKK